MRNNAGRKLTRYQFPSLINTAWSKAATVQNGVSGFKTCGIHSLDELIIPDYAYRYNENESTTVSTTPVTPAAATVSPTLSATVPDPALTTTAKDQEITTDPALPTAPADLESIAAIPSTSFYDIRRIPTISSPSGRASNRKQHVQILTSPDVIAAKRTKKEKMKATVEKRAQNAAKKKSNLKQTVVKKGKNQKLRQRIESSSSSSSSVEMSVHSTDDDQDIINESPKCDRLQCLKCSRWVHETCTNSATFCEDCYP
ncbi:hypothetical protein FQA39_LY10969 [Lamprigera yunnana]|nr:hypothetical protein FQA39_LY10969 [Lamprigera yunnana]